MKPVRFPDCMIKKMTVRCLHPGQRGNVLQVFEDKPMGNDAWDIEIYYQEKMRVIDGLTCFEVKECGSVRLVLHMDGSI